jgi:hypothetical protein
MEMYVVLVEGDLTVCALGVFSTLEKAREYAEGTEEKTRRMFVEKFRVDEPYFYEDESEYIVWTNY